MVKDATAIMTRYIFAAIAGIIAGLLAALPIWTVVHDRIRPGIVESADNSQYISYAAAIGSVNTYSTLAAGFVFLLMFAAVVAVALEFTKRGENESIAQR